MTAWEAERTATRFSVLPPDQYNAVVAYVLRENGYPAGDTPLLFEPLEIAHINLDPHPEEPEAP